MEIFSSIRSRSIKLASRTSTNRSNQTSSFARSNTADYGSLYWNFDPNNHCLSERLTHFVYHKWTIRVWASTWILWWLIGAAGVPTSVYYGYYVVRNMFFSVPYLTLLILSFNRDACGFLIRSSEFWIKICYAIANGALHMILYHQVGRKQATSPQSQMPEWLGYTTFVVTMIRGPLFMAVVGGMDAIPKMKYKWKVCLVAVVALWYTVLAINYQMLTPVKHDYVIEIKATESVLSFHAMLANVNGMLAMFLCKQMIDVIRNKDRCISINYRPYLRWEPVIKESILLDSVIPESSTEAIATAVN